MQTKKPPTVTHTPNSLVIEIPTKCAPALHYTLMQGLSAGIASHVGNEIETKKDAQHIIALVNLLRDMLPPEDVLLKAYA